MQKIHQTVLYWDSLIIKLILTNLYDQVIAVKDNDAFKCSRLIVKNKGILVGISSGAALCAATELANCSENIGKTIVVVLTNTGKRYLSTELFV